MNDFIEALRALKNVLICEFEKEITSIQRAMSWAAKALRKIDTGAIRAARDFEKAIASVASIRRTRSPKAERCDNCKSRIDVRPEYGVDRYGVWSCEKRCALCRFIEVFHD